MIKKINKVKAWIQADIPCIDLTPNLYNALTPAIVYVSNDATISTNFLRYTDRHLNITLISSCTRAKPWMFDSVYIKGNQMTLFQ